MSRIMQSVQYSEKEWYSSNSQKCDNADRKCSLSQNVTESCNRVCDELRARMIKENQLVTKTHEERIKDVKYWKNEADNKVKDLDYCINRILEFKDRIQNAITHYTPLPAAFSQCLRIRTERQGIEKVNDRSQQVLQKCVSYFQHLLQKLERLRTDVIEQARLIKSTKFMLNQDLNDKYATLDLEMIQVNVPPVKPTNYLQKPFFSEAKPLTIEEWVSFCMRNIKKAEEQEIKSQSLYVRAEETLNECYSDFEKSHKTVIETMEDRINETKEVKIMLEERVAKVSKEIDNLEEAVRKLQEAFDLKTSMLSISQSKINRLRYRPSIGLCEDKVELELEREVMQLEDSVQQLRNHLNVATNTMQSLHNIRKILEEDIRIKNHTIFLDEGYCMSVLHKISIVPF